MAKYVVIFDMDGVLVDTNGLILDSFNVFLRPYGLSINSEDFKGYLGITAKGLVERWKKEYGIIFDENFIKEETTRMHLDSLKGYVIDPQLVELLRDLRENNIPMAVGTSSPRKRAEKILDILGIRNFFSYVITGDDVSTHKPDPELFLKAAESLGVDPHICVIIEDAENGIEAAKRGGMKAIGYVTKYHKREELKKADLLIDNFAELSYERVKVLFT